jgi:hypothetical protein
VYKKINIKGLFKMNLGDKKFNIQDISNTFLSFGKLESPLEIRFFNHIEKYLDPSFEIKPQAELEVLKKKFRMDFIITNGKYRVGIECDGEEYHSGEIASWLDEWKDALYLLHEKVDVIYRFVSEDIFNHIECIILFLIQNERNVFQQSNYRGLEEKCSLLNSDGYISTMYSHSQRVFKSRDALKVVNREIGKGKVDIVWLKMFLLTYVYPDLELQELIGIYKSENDIDALMERYKAMYQKD